uniref:Beta-defensin n=1 Tax=Sus scrofa TaxID=9823 RepID=A0A8D1Y139_PIG
SGEFSALRATLILLNCFPTTPPQSGQNIYIRRLLNTCWRMKGVCRTVCKKNEIFHIFCGLHQLCCIDASSMPVLTGK